MGVMSEEVEEELADGLIVGIAKSTERIKIICKGGDLAFRIHQTLMRSLMKTWQYWRVSCLQKVYDQADPCVRTESSTKRCAFV